MNTMMLDGGYQELPGALEARLNIASGLENEHGMRMRVFGKDDHVMGLLTVPEHMCGWQGIVHGGIVSTMLDDIMGWAIIFVLDKFMLTKSITVNYFKPAYTGTPLRIKSDVYEEIDDREVKMKATLFDEEGQVCTEAIGTFAVFSYESALRLPMVEKNLIEKFFKMVRSIKN